MQKTSYRREIPWWRAPSSARPYPIPAGTRTIQPELLRKVGTPWPTRSASISESSGDGPAVPRGPQRGRGCADGAECRWKGIGQHLDFGMASRRPAPARTRAGTGCAPSVPRGLLDGGGILVVRGGAGIGKSSRLGAAAGEAAGRDMETLSRTAVQAEFRLPSPPPTQCSASSAAPCHRR